MMVKRLKEMRDRIRDREQRKWRQDRAPDLITECEAEGLSWMMRAARLTHRQCEAERPIIEPDQRIVFTRTVPVVPPIYNPDDWERLFSGRSRHELGPISNICADWGLVLSQGLLSRRAVALDNQNK